MKLLGISSSGKFKFSTRKAGTLITYACETRGEQMGVLECSVEGTDNTCWFDLDNLTSCLLFH